MNIALKGEKKKFKNLINWHTDTDIMYPFTEQLGNFKCVFLLKKLIGFIPGRTFDYHSYTDILILHIGKDNNLNACINSIQLKIKANFSK